MKIPMRSLIALLAIILSPFTHAAPTPPPLSLRAMPFTPDTSTPLSTARSFLAGIKTRNIDGMLALCVADVSGVLIRNGVPTYRKMADVLAPVRDLDPDIYADEVGFDEVELVDGDYAVVWVPYRFYQPEKAVLHHTGTNTFSLWRDPVSGWVITSISDVARLVDCGEA